MAKPRFRGVKGGITKSRPVKSVKSLMTGALLFALLPLQMLTPAFSAPETVTTSAAVWQTKLMLADTSPVLLAPHGDETKSIVKEISRYNEELAKQEAAKKRQQQAAVKVQVSTASKQTVVVADVSYEQKLALVEKAAATYNIPSKLLLAVWKVESGMRWYYCGGSSAGARGPAQFMPGTWRKYGVDGNGDGKKDICHAEDAIPAAANYLAANGASRGDYYRALFAYNHADWYVKKVLALAGMSS